MIQWFRLVFYIKLLSKKEDDEETEQEYLDAAATIRSQAIDRRLEEDATWLRRETKIVLLGAYGSGKDLIMRQMKVLYAEGYPQDERITYRYQVRTTVRLLIHAMVDLIKDTGINLPGELNQDFAILLNEIETVQTDTITPAGVRAVQNIWESESFSTLYVRNFEMDFPLYAPYFATQIERISAEDYIPTEADIIRLNTGIGAIQELRFTWDELDVHLFNIGRRYLPDSFKARWFHQLENATALVYTVDVSTYDRAYVGTKTPLFDDFATFENWIQNPLFANSSIILLLNNFTRFREKLPHSPLETFFPDYYPSVTVDAETSARQYILKRFKDVNVNRLSIYSFWVDLDMSDNQHLYAALKKTLNHIQVRKARGEVGSASAVTSAPQSRGKEIYEIGRSRSGTLNELSRSGTVTSSSAV
jgi:guanine nucleotide-binding protein subunit alpha